VSAQVSVTPDVFDRLDRMRAAYRKGPPVHGSTLVDLSVGSPDVGPDANWQQLVCQFIRDGNMHGYGAFGVEVNSFLKERFLAYYERRFLPITQHGVLHADRNVTDLLGSKEGIFHCMHAVLEPGRTVLLPNPGYAVYDTIARSVGAPVRLLRHDKRGQVDLSTLTPTQLNTAGMLVLCSPNNPTGVVIDPDTVTEAIRLAEEYGFVLVLDRAYEELRHGPGTPAPIDVAKFDGASSRLVELHSLSKSVGVAGWRVGFAVGTAAAIGQIRASKNLADFGMFLPFQRVAARILDELEAISRQTAQVYQRRIVRFTDRLASAGWRIAQPDAGFFLWAELPVRYPSECDVTFAEDLLRHTGVLVAPGSGFGSAGRGYVRIALVQPDFVLDDAADRISDWIDVLAAGST
jgi:LL-diaminopimelate aminotransferase/alanine-synthesizing transaminase